MQANQTQVVWTIVIAAVILLVVGLFSVSSVNSNLKLVDKNLDGLDIDEQAIADAVLAGIEVPEYPEFPEYMISEDEYKEAIWEDAAIALATEELEADNYELLALYLLIDEDDVEEVIIREIEVGTLTVVKVEDKDADVFFKLRVYYDDGSISDWDVRETVYVKAIVSDGEVDNLVFKDTDYWNQF